MRRIGVAFAVLAAGVLLVFGSGASDDGDGYQVRAIFDSGGFLVPGEEVRIAGVKVGSISEVDVTRPGEVVHEDGSDDPGKAVVVLDITEPGFQDFLTDAQCIIRPQSLLGEKFVECRPTEPRAPGSEPPPPLEQIGDGAPGEGQYLLPIERNSKAVDLDLVNNIMKEPYPDRFRLILNDLGAGLAARGDDLEEVVQRANPALQQTNRVLAILAKQNKKLASLARDGDSVLGPLAGQRERIKGFINNATVAAEATAERRADLEANIQKLPPFLRELRATMTELDRFSTQSTPVISDLGDAAPALNRINLALEPVSRYGTPALESLGDAADEVGPDLAASEPVLKDLQKLAKGTVPVASNLSKLLRSTRTHDGYANLLKLLLNLGGAVNVFDSYGHFVRAQLPVNNCVDYVTGVSEITCDAHWRHSSKAPTKAQNLAAYNDLLAQADRLQADAEADRTAPPTSPDEPAGGDQPAGGRQGSEALLDYLLGSEPTAEKGGGR